MAMRVLCAAVGIGLGLGWVSGCGEDSSGPSSHATGGAAGAGGTAGQPDAGDAGGASGGSDASGGSAGDAAGTDADAESCTDQCALDALGCVAGEVQKCVQQASGCTNWKVVGSADTSVVDASSNQLGMGSSLRVDGAGSVDVSYYDSANQTLRHAHKSSQGGWSLESVAPTGENLGSRTSLARDVSGGLHVIYRFRSGSTSELRYAHLASGGSWSTSTIDSGDDILDPSLAVDASGAVHVSYQQKPKYQLQYAHLPNAGSWTITTPDTATPAGSHGSLAIDSAGGVHVSYCDDSSGNLKHAFLVSGGTWSTESAKAAGCSTSSLAADAAGGLHLSVASLVPYSQPRLGYAYEPAGGSWSLLFLVQSSTALPYSGDSFPSSLAVGDKSGQVFISYLFGSSLNLLKGPIGATSASSWVNATLISGSLAAGQDSSIGVDSTGGIHISYFTGSALGYAFACQ